MEENSPRVPRREGGGPTTERGRGKKQQKKGERYGGVDEGGGGGGGGGDLVECSGKYCRSCTAGVIADCVALCCCPCALLNLLTLAFVKVPWKMGRRCLGLGKSKRNKKLEMKRKCRKSCCCCAATSTSNDHHHHHHQFGDIGNLRTSVRVDEEMWEFSTVFKEEEEEAEMGNFSARFEAERVWLELYQVGHLGFGRVSFTGL